MASALLLGACRREPAKPEPFTISQVVAEKNGDHIHLEVIVRIPAGPALTLKPPVCQLYAGGKPVPPFIAPGLQPSMVAARAQAEAPTHWWLPADTRRNSLELEINGSRRKVPVEWLEKGNQDAELSDTVLQKTNAAPLVEGGGVGG